MEKGFTLLEALIAILILTMGIVAVLQIFPLAFSLEMATQRETQGIMLCQEKIEEMISKNYSDIQVGTQTEDPLSPPFEKFSRETKVSLVDANLNSTTTDIGLKKAEVRIFWQSGLKIRENEVKLTTLIAEK